MVGYIVRRYQWKLGHAVGLTCRARWEAGRHIGWGSRAAFRSVKSTCSVYHRRTDTPSREILSRTIGLKRSIAKQTLGKCFKLGVSSNFLMKYRSAEDGKLSQFCRLSQKCGRACCIQHDDYSIIVMCRWHTRRWEHLKTEKKVRNIKQNMVDPL